MPMRRPNWELAGACLWGLVNPQSMPWRTVLTVVRGRLCARHPQSNDPRPRSSLTTKANFKRILECGGGAERDSARCENAIRRIETSCARNRALSAAVVLPMLIPSSLQAGLGPKGIDHFEKPKLIEIGVAGANSPDAVFAQKNGDVRAVEQMLPIDLLTNWLAIDDSHLFPWRTSLWLRLNKLGRCRRWCRARSGGRWCDGLCVGGDLW
jgi:hypothetical protein